MMIQENSSSIIDEIKADMSKREIIGKDAKGIFKKTPQNDFAAMANLVLKSTNNKDEKMLTALSINSDNTADEVINSLVRLNDAWEASKIEDLKAALK